MAERNSSLWLVALLWVSAGCGAAWAQMGGQTGIATLHVEAREVVLDVVVTDKKGRVVTGLSKEDFLVVEDRTPQVIKSFQSPGMHAIPVGAPEVESTQDLQKIGNAPVNILVLDELDTQFTDMAYARGALQKWLEAQPVVLPQPTVLMVASDEKFAVIRDFTQDREALLAALKAHFPSYPFRMSKGGSIGPDAGERMAMSLGTLMQIAQASTGTPGRKNVIWVGVGFPQLLLDDVSGDKESEIVKAAERATDAMLKARVTLNVIDPTAMADSSLDMNNTDYLSIGVLNDALGPTSATVSGILNFDTFAPATGGRLYVGNNDVQGQIKQAVEDGANFYTISYSPSNHSDDATKFRNISVVMKDPSLTATTRTGYFSEAASDPSVAPVAPTTHDLVFDLTNAGLSSIAYNGVQATADKAGEGYVIHARMADLTPHVLRDGRSDAEVTVMVVCFAAKNKVLSHVPFELHGVVPAGGAGMVDFTTPKVVAPKGTVRMRLVVRDAISGRIGTVDVGSP